MWNNTTYWSVKVLKVQIYCNCDPNELYNKLKERVVYHICADWSTVAQMAEQVKQDWKVLSLNPALIQWVQLQIFEVLIQIFAIREYRVSQNYKQGSWVFCLKMRQKEENHAKNWGNNVFTREWSLKHPFAGTNIQHLIIISSSLLALQPFFLIL